MKQMIISVLTSFLIVQGAPGNDITGVWLTQKKDSKIEIERNPDGSYEGKIIWAQAPHESYVGKVVMKGVVFDPGSGKYKCPWVYDPRLDLSAHATITLNGDTMRVMASKGILSKRETFIKVGN